MWQALVDFNDAIWGWVKDHPRTTLGFVSILVVLLALKGLLF